MSPGAAPLEPNPTPEDFAPRAVERAVRNEAVQHPLTIVPAAGALGFGLWNLAVGLGPVSVLGMLGLAFVGGVSAAYQYLIRGDDHAKRYIEGRLALRRQFEAQQVEDLIGDCRRAGFDDGVAHLTALRDAYRAFEGTTHDEEGSATFVHLGRDAFREAVDGIRRALEITEARRGMDVARLTQRRDALQASAKTDPAAARELAATTQRIDRNGELGELGAELLARATEIETALENVRLDLAAQGGAELAQSERGSGAQLATALEAARRVQARALGRERGDGGADAEYLQAGRATSTDKEGTHGG